MNKEIDSIVNITTAAILDATGQWTYGGSVPIADEVVIRQITYSSTNALATIFSIRSDLSNNVIASVCAIKGFTSNPNTRIQLRTPPGNYINFQLLLPTGASTVLAATDYISINMDFIKYRR